ncbi:hypothetical protein MMC26_001868 [Xylographa opegraphella]|nr:hypothetical protein [Xylographa opegraphella]
MPDGAPAFRYVPAESYYVTPAWQTVTQYRPMMEANERALRNDWHQYLMYGRWMYGRTYDEILVWDFGEHRAVEGFAPLAPVELTDEFWDWALWELRRWLKEGRFVREGTVWAEDVETSDEDVDGSEEDVDGSEDPDGSADTDVSDCTI